MQFHPLRKSAFRGSIAICGALVLAGCGAETGRDANVSSRALSESASRAPADKSIGFAPPGPAEASGDSGAADSAAAAESIARKLIYTADVQLVADDLDSVAASIESLVRKHRGFIANSQLAGTRGSRRSGTWQVRIPADQFEDFLSATAAIGEVRSIARKSEDVTEEFFDVEARIRNKRVQEGGLLKILEHRAGELEDVLAVERELSRVREEIERMEGRLRLLSDLTSLTTINIEVEEIQNYVPEQTPTFARRVSRSFQGSLTALQRAGENAVIVSVAIIPWLIGLLLLASPVLGLVRWSQRRGS